MSVKLVTQAFETTLPPTEKLILICLADATNDSGRGCWPSLATIARKCSVSDRTVRRALGKMEDHGLLSRQFRVGRSTIVHLHIEAWPMQPPVPRACPTGQTPDNLSGVSDCHPGHRCPPTPDTGVRQNRNGTKGVSLGKESRGGGSNNYGGSIGGEADFCSPGGANEFAEEETPW